MPSEKKLLALRKSYEVQEGAAREAHRAVETVHDERLALLREEEQALADVEERLRSLMGSQRASACAKGTGAALESVRIFRDRLQSEKEQVAKRVASAQKEVERSSERLEIAHDELLEIRIEVKKLDKILEDRALRSKIRDAAREEIVADEMNFYRRRK